MFNANKTQTPSSSVNATLRKLAIGISPVVAMIALPSFATVCVYDASTGFVDPLGERASLTIESTEGDTEFIYERLPAIVSSDSTEIKAEVDNKRTLTLYETPIEAARQLLLDDSTYYAVLLGLAPDDPFIARGFATINQTLTCSEDSSSTAEADAPPVPAPLPAVPQPPTPPVQ